jgi:hypothetical protein
MESKKSTFERFVFRYKLDRRLYRFVGAFFLAKTAYMVATEGALLADLEEELLEESQQLQDVLDQDLKATLTSHNK